MSDNPYSPPAADLGSEANAFTGEGTGDFRIGQCLSDAWANTWANFPLWVGVGGLLVVTAAASLATVIGILIALPVLFWGWTLFQLRMHDRNAELANLFAGFSSYGESLAGILIFLLVTIAIAAPGQALATVGELTDNLVLSGVGGLLNLAIAILVLPRLNFAYFYIVDRRMPGVEAARMAWADTAPVKWKVIGLWSTCGLLLAAGAAAVGILTALVDAGLLWFMVVLGALVLGPGSVMFGLATVSAYRQLVGRPA